MSHFAVLVRVPASIPNAGGARDAAEALLAPFQENNMGDCPPEYLTFHDQTEEVEEKLAELHSDTPPSYYSAKEIAELLVKYPGKTLAELAAVNPELPDQFVKSLYGYKRDTRPEAKPLTYGYWENENAKWDWYVIGGRWMGFLPCLPSFSDGTAKGRPGVMGSHYEDKPTSVDVARIGWLDWATINEESIKEVEEAFARFDRMRKDDRWFVRMQDEPGYEALTMEQKQRVIRKHWEEGDWRGTFMKLGELKAISFEEAEALKPTEEKPIGEWVLRPWPPKDGEQRRVYAWSTINRGMFIDKHRFYFNRLRCYAFLDQRGWIQPGELGWFGTSHASADSYAAYCKAFDSWIRDGDSQDWLVVVDCHI